LKKSFELPNTGRVAHLAQSLCFDLTNALTSDLELPAYFFKRSAVTVDQPETLLEHLPLAICQSFEDIFNFLLQQNNRSHIAGVFSASVLDKVAKIRFFAFADGRLKCNRMLAHRQHGAH